MLVLEGSGWSTLHPSCLLLGHSLHSHCAWDCVGLRAIQYECAEKKISYPCPAHSKLPYYAIPAPYEIQWHNINIILLLTEWWFCIKMYVKSNVQFYQFEN